MMQELEWNFDGFSVLALAKFEIFYTYGIDYFNYIYLSMILKGPVIMVLIELYYEQAFQ
jgi:hypothetical protein